MLHPCQLLQHPFEAQERNVGRHGRSTCGAPVRAAHDPDGEVILLADGTLLAEEDAPNLEAGRIQLLVCDVATQRLDHLRNQRIAHHPVVGTDRIEQLNPLCHTIPAEAIECAR